MIELLDGFVAMPKSSHLAHSFGSHARQAGPSASVPAPSTPQKDGKVLGQLIRSFEAQHHLGLTVSAESKLRFKDLSKEDVVTNRIQDLYFLDATALKDAFETFAAIAESIVKSEQLDALLKILRYKIQHSSPMSRATTPLSKRNTQSKDLRVAVPGKLVPYTKTCSA